MDRLVQHRMQELVTVSTSNGAATSGALDHLYDNASNHCIVADGFCTMCQDQSVLMVALQWTRIFILKVGRMYYVAPIFLMALPLLIGLVVGYVVGRGGLSNSIKSPLNRAKATMVFSAYSFVGKIWTFVYGTSSSVVSSDTEYTWNDRSQKQPNLMTTVVDANDDDEKLEQVRSQLRSAAETNRESGVELAKVPKHIAVIMDGNRRYGRKYHPDNPTQGHWDGSKTLVDFCKWCIAEHVQMLTVYAFSTENWNRHPSEVAALMTIFIRYCDELRVEAKKRNIRIHVLSTESDRIPAQVKAGMKRMVEETAHCEGGLTLNICLSYGSRGEIVKACRDVATDVQQGQLNVQDVTEELFQERLLVGTDPDLIIRTSGEYRLSNFLLWQLAYSELFFLPKTWPEVKKADLLEVIRSFAGGRNRRFGK